MDFSEIRGARVLIRVGFDVPVRNGKVVSDDRIRDALPAIRALIKQKCSVVIASHLGRPAGKRQQAYSMRPVAERLAKLLRRPVRFETAVLSARKTAASLKPGEILMLENLRFYPGEEGNDPTFAQRIAALGEVYVNEAFSVSHRDHASIVGIPRHLPSALGPGFAREVEMLSLLKKPERPYLAIIGGAKISTKLTLLKSLARSANHVYVGGAMAFTILAADGHDVGLSKVEKGKVKSARSLLGYRSLELPIDAGVAKSVSENAKRTNRAIDSFEPGDIGLDIGPRSVRELKRLIREAKTIVWNGPLGLFELPEFADASEQIAKALARRRATIIVGGGDTIAAIEAAGIPTDRFTHVSTGGGAMLAFLEKGTLLGLRAIERSR